MAAPVAIGCSELLGSASTDKIASISALGLPYPTVVVGDTMRDTLGVATPVTITAFDVDGKAVTTEAPHFTILDATTSTVATTVQVDQNGYVHGLALDPVGARVYAGFGTLIAPVQRITVSVAPTTATKSAATTEIVFDITTTDSTVQTNWSPPLELTLRNGAGTAALGFIVTYAITRSPAPKAANDPPTAFLVNDVGKASSRDTTNLAGVAGRRVILRQLAIGNDSVRAGLITDTIIVRATAKYNGLAIAGTPVDYVIPLKKKP